MKKFQQKLAQLMGKDVAQLIPLSGGCIAEVYCVQFADGTTAVAKVADGKGVPLDIEGYMLQYLNIYSRLPVPGVYYCSENLLVMEFLDGDSKIGDSEQLHAAELLADLHSIRADRYGFERDTLIGGIHQPNPMYMTWIDFFRDQRLMYMAREALSAEQLPAAVMARIEHFAEQIDRWLEEPPYPSLLHGDMWTTNMLAKDGRVVGFLDPAIYYGHPEIELAFSTLFNTFGPVFFRRYEELRPISIGFYEERRDIYNLYPLLVHVRLFGSGYVSNVDRVLKRFGF